MELRVKPPYYPSAFCLFVTVAQHHRLVSVALWQQLSLHLWHQLSAAAVKIFHSSIYVCAHTWHIQWHCSESCQCRTHIHTRRKKLNKIRCCRLAVNCNHTSRHRSPLSVPYVQTLSLAKWRLPLEKGGPCITYRDEAEVFLRADPKCSNTSSRSIFTL